MHLLSFTPTGCVAPIIRLIESAHNPYVSPTEDIIQKSQRLSERREPIANHLLMLEHTARIQGQRLADRYQIINVNKRVSSRYPSQGYMQIAEDIYLHQKIFSVMNTDPMVKRHIRLLYEISNSNRMLADISTAATSASAQVTKRAKQEMADLAAINQVAVDPLNIPRSIIISTYTIPNPYWYKLSFHHVRKLELIKFAGTPYGYIHLGPTVLGNMQIITKALKRNGKDWGVGYGYHIYSLPRTPKQKPSSGAFIFVANDESVVWEGASARLINVRGTPISQHDFPKLSSQDQDNFITGKT